MQDQEKQHAASDFWGLILLSTESVRLVNTRGITSECQIRLGVSVTGQLGPLHQMIPMLSGYLSQGQLSYEIWQNLRRAIQNEHLIFTLNVHFCHPCIQATNLNMHKLFTSIVEVLGYEIGGNMIPVFQKPSHVQNQHKYLTGKKIALNNERLGCLDAVLRCTAKSPSTTHYTIHRCNIGLCCKTQRQSAHLFTSESRGNPINR